jgi:peptidoglycan/LPS O-acetylase OafA/YrhL
LTIESSPEAGRIGVVDPLRGLAALAVAWFHIAHEMGLFRQDSLAFSTSAYGRSGVQAFFVISGFVIPYALTASGYHVRDYGRFLLKRLVRLDPPYIAAILLSVLIAAYHTIVGGDRFPYSWPQLLSHLGYANAYFGYEWVSWVFWTLAIEIQFYIAIGLIFPVLKYPKVFWGFIAFPLMAIAVRNLNSQAVFVAAWIPFFLMGIAAFHLRMKQIHPLLFALLVIAPTLYAILFAGMVPAIAALMTATIVGLVSLRLPRALVWLGLISYSLYLIHNPIAGIVVSALRGKVPGMTAAFLALTACFLAAWGMYRLVESPSKRLSKRIRYKGGLQRQSQRLEAVPVFGE